MLALAITCQLLAVGCAVYLMVHEPRRGGWLMIALGAAMMGIIRALAFARGGLVSDPLMDTLMFASSLALTVGLLMIIRVLREMRSIEAEGAVNAQRLASFVENSDDAIVTKAMDGTITTWNPAAEKIFGYTAEEAVGKSILMIVPEDKRTEEFEILETIAAGGRVDHLETARTTKDGRRLNIAITTSPIKDRQGNIVAASKIGRDITDRKRREKRLRETKEWLELTQEAGKVVSFDWDMQLGTLTWSPNVSDIFGRPEFTLNSWYRSVHPDDLSPLKLKIQEAIDSRKDYKAEFRFYLPNGEMRWVAGHGRIIYDEEGNPLRMLGINFDVTERKQTEDNLRQVAKELSESNQDLEIFAGAASHDLKAPLNTINGYLELMLRKAGPKLDAQEIGFLTSAKEGVTRMNSLLNHLLEFSSLTARAQSLAPVDFGKSLADAIANLHALISERQPIITNDPLPIAQAHHQQAVLIFQNLISNGIKYARNSQPVIHVSCREEAGEYVFGVRDNGIGIEKKHAERIFGLFERVTTQENLPGTGLGLAVCRRLVQRLGGRIWVESLPGAGSTFYFTIPRAQERGMMMAVGQ